MTQFFLGIDIAKDTYHVTLLKDNKSQHGEFLNQPKEFKRLTSWLKKHGVKHVQACMEATGRYGDDLALYLHEEGHRLSVVNPMRIKSYARSQMIRNKTDKLDSAVIADFCKTCQPLLWVPPTPELLELQEFLRQYEALQQSLTQIKNRLQAGFRSSVVIQQLQEQLTFLEQQRDDLKERICQHLDSHPDLKHQRELLETIPGISTITAAAIIAQNVERFDDARSFASYAGVTPMQGTSGSSVHRKPKLSKMGNANLRKALYMPAVTAIRFNPFIRALAKRLQTRGKCPMSIIGAAMHKLLVIAYGVIKSGIPFDPNYSSKVRFAS